MTPNEEALQILESLTVIQRGALAHLLNNALAPLVLEIGIQAGTDMDESLAHLLDIVEKITGGK